ncbi:MAG: ATP-binding protein [Nitrospirota bacterium]|nr:ATP-binding protein [Nitrospirota bacterium]
MQRTFTRVMSPLYERMFLVLTIVFCSSLAVMLLNVSRLQGHLIESMALVNGELYATVLSQLQTLYSSDLVQRVRVYDLQNIATAAVFLVVVWAGGMGLVINKYRRNSHDRERQGAPQSTDLREAMQQLERERMNRQQVEEHLRQAHAALEERVNERTSQLQQVNAALSQEIAERRRAEAGIRELNVDMLERTVRLEASNKELEAFSHSVSHDLRAPLRSIDGFSQALLDDCGPQLDTTARNYVLRVKEASHRMDTLIEAMLNLSHLSRTDLNLRPVDLTSLVRSVMEGCQQADPARQVEWVVMENLTTTADATLLRVVLENLIGNAVKFTGQVPYPRIEFGVTYQYAQPVFYVRDNGAGFDMTYADKLFGIFQRLHGAKEFPGMGIGLATVHRIIHRHGGRVWADAAVGSGATFFLSLEPQAGTP